MTTPRSLPVFTPKHLRFYYDYCTGSYLLCSPSLRVIWEGEEESDFWRWIGAA